MKLAFLAAAALGAVLAGAAPASAQRTVVHERTVVHDAPVHRWHSRRVCRTEWRHHHRVRVCRTVRSR